MPLLKIITINEHQAVINYDPDIKMYRGEFFNIDGESTDFYAPNMYRLKKEGAISLKVLLELLDEDNLIACHN
jgi:predicted HicB family RNase H-like nuclease